MNAEGATLEAFPDIAGYRFGEPLAHLRDVPPGPAVFALLYRADDGRWRLFDVDAAHDVPTRLLAHPRSGCWRRVTGGRPLAVALHPLAAATGPFREGIVRAIRARYPDLPCR
jgi:hypothetical protein